MDVEEILKASFVGKGTGGYETYLESSDKRWHFRLTPIGRQRRETEEKRR